MNIFLLFLWISFIHTAPTRSPKPYDPFLDGLNEIRSSIAISEHVGWMFRLLWNNSMASMAADSSVPIDQFRHFVLKSLKDPENDFNAIEKTGKEAVGSQGKTSKENEYIEALLPHQEEIGCAQRKGISGYLCFLAPIKEFELWRFNSQETPGGGCYKGMGFFAIGGLCTFLGNPEVFVYRMNNVRRKLAKQYNIPDMHDMIGSLTGYNQISEYFIDDENFDISPFHISTFRFSNYSEREILAEVNGFLRMSEPRRAEYWKKPGLKFAEFITPSLNIVLCVWAYQTEKFLCVFGPRYSNDIWNIKSNPLNAPATECSDGFLAKDGLCTPSSYTPNYLVATINWARKEVARALKIENMLELTWNDDLAKIAQSVKYERSNIDSSVKLLSSMPPDCRYVFDTIWDGQFQYSLWKNHKEWIRKNSTEQTKFITENSSKFMKFLEFFNPIQSQIGCVFEGDRSFVHYVLCVLGPHDKFVRYDKAPKAKLGSKCPNDFNSKGGFCIRLGDSKEFLDNLNDFRRELSVKHNITNMHQMAWEKSLVKIAKNTDWSESKDPVVVDYRYVLLNDYRSIEKLLETEVKKLKTFTSSALGEAFQKMPNSSFGISELLDPLQKFIGCTYKDQPIAPGILCILGPRHFPTPLKLENPPQRILGTASKFRIYTAGTNCSAGYENDRGLCIVKDIKNISLAGSLDHFLKDLNEFRRDVAKEFNIQSMHKLEWNSDLESMMESLAIDETWQEARKSFRFVLFDEYNKVLDRIHHNISWIRYLDSKLKWKILDSKTECAGFLELVEPHQTMIACGRKKSKKSGKSKILCLIGPHPAIQLWLMTPLGPRELGITCGNTPGYENDDGLCVKKSGIDPNFYGDHKKFLDELNKSRKNRAMFFSIPNFYALSWSEELVEKSKTFPYTTDPVLNPEIQGHRYFTMGTYKEFNEGDITSEWITKIRHLKVDEAREKYIKDRLTTTMGILETQHPGQHSIGCSLRNEKSGVFFLCLLAPEISYPLLKFQPLQRVGTKCPDGYKNVNGLCAPGEKPPKRKRKSRTSTQKPSSTTQKAKKSSDHLIRSIWKILAPLIVFYICFP